MFKQVAGIFILVFSFGCDGTLEANLVDAESAEESQEEAYAADPAEDPTLDARADSFEPAPSTEVPDEPEEELEPESESEPEVAEPPEPEEPARPEPGSIVEFTIAEGTGSNPWNSKENPVEVYVGQFLVVYNNDSRPHRIHSPQNGPFPHGREIPPGGFSSYEIVRALDVGETPTLYDHDDGPGAAFWLRAIE